MDYWDGEGGRSYHHTAPINALYGLHESLRRLHEEGLEAAWARHRHHHKALKAGLAKLGLDYIVPEGERIPQLNAVTVPKGVDEAAVRHTLLHDYQLEIGAGLGDMAGTIWRIGLMGYSCRAENVRRCLQAIGETLQAQGLDVDPGAAVATADEQLSTRPAASA
jgi:alanine-glyoxylate transaminase/serine-glyoxylate transaminase/serine-pyruvate transaminase